MTRVLTEAGIDRWGVVSKGTAKGQAWTTYRNATFVPCRHHLVQSFRLHLWELNDLGHATRTPVGFTALIHRHLRALEHRPSGANEHSPQEQGVCREDDLVRCYCADASA